MPRERILLTLDDAEVSVMNRLGEFLDEHLGEFLDEHEGEGDLGLRLEGEQLARYRPFIAAGVPPVIRLDECVIVEERL